MNTSKIRHPVLLSVGILVLFAAITAVINRDTIADLILRGGDVSLTDEAARNSPQAKLAIDFLGALRAMDKDAIGRMATAEHAAQINQETEKPSADAQQMRTTCLNDLPADPAALRSRIKSVQVHKDRAAVLAETRANQWFVLLTLVGGSWKVSGF